MFKCIIQVTNKRKESVTVVVSTNKPLQILSETLSVTIPGYEFIKSYFTDDEVRVPKGETTVVNEVGFLKIFSYAVGCTNAECYKIKVTTEDGEKVAECETPLHCTWIVDDDKIYRQDDPSKCKRFCLDTSSHIIKVINKTEEVMRVVVNRKLLFQIWNGDLLAIGSYLRDKYFKEVQVEPGKKTAIQKVNTGSSTSDYCISKIEDKLNVSTCSIKVIRKRDKRAVQCQTSLRCTWIVQNDGMWQENKPEQIHKFQ